MINIEKNYSINARRMKKSAIRQLLKLASKPEIISFAGGLPAPEAFPVEEIADIASDVIKRDGKKALQYGATEGYSPLVEELIKWEKETNDIDIKPENLIITTASQQALDLIGKIFIDPSDPVIVERPTYLGGLSAFNQYGAKFIGIPMEKGNSGIDMDYLEQELERLKKSQEHYKFVYVVPDFQNPTGLTIPTEKREKLIELSEKYEFLLIEDSPYRELRYEGTTPELMYKMDNTGNVLSVHTFSKIFAPGMRIGWVVGNEKIIDKLNTAKQAADLCTSTFTQAVTAEFMKRGLLQKNIDKVKKIYKRKKDLMIEGFKQYLPQREDITWTDPDGGLFLWLTLPKYINTDKMFDEALKENIAYIVGSAFDCYGESLNTMRINFSYPSEDDIVEGVKRLANLIKKNIKD